MYERKSGIFPVSAILLVFFMSVNVASANSSQTTTETDQQQDSVLGSWVMVEGFNWKEEPGLPPSEKTHFVSEKDNPAYFLVRAFEESTLQTNVFGSKNERKDCYHTNLDLLAKTDSNIYQNKFGNTHELVLKDNRLHATTRHVSSGVVWERIYERESSFSPKSFLEERCNRASSDSSMFGVWKATSVTFNPGELVLPSEITYIAVTRIFEDAIMLSVYQKHGDCYVAANNAFIKSMVIAMLLRTMR